MQSEGKSNMAPLTDIPTRKMCNELDKVDLV